MALPSSPEQPQPLRVVSKALADYIGRLGPVWVEGQVTELNPRSGQSYLRLRDLEADISTQLVADSRLIGQVQPALVEGSRVVVQLRVEYWTRRGSLNMRATDIRAVGLGDLLARIELLKQQLAREGLFAPERKRPLPFLPGLVGLVCGRGSAAERDVVENACRRWPAIRFEVRQVPVQGPAAAGAVAAAVAELDEHPEVDVIIVSRGGGSIEDLLPFSDETLVRAVAACRTPVISAVGHEQDNPLIDLVADVRASTPTDAARKVVPDLAEQLRLVADLRDRSGRVLRSRIETEAAHLLQLRRRPALADPTGVIDQLGERVHELSRRSSRELATLLTGVTQRLDHDRARLRAVSPQATLERGYAVVTTIDGAGDGNRQVIRDPAEVSVGECLLVRVAGGSFDVDVVASPSEPASARTSESGQ